MAEFLKNSPIALRHCILYEFLRKNPVEASFNAFCETVGDDVIGEEEFKFWFNRFEQGNFDLNFERKQDKKDKNKYELTDMPLDVMEKIVEQLDIYDRHALTRTCRSVHQFVQDQKVFVHTLNLSIYTSVIYVFASELFLRYKECDDADCLKQFNEKKTIIQGVPYWKQALLDFKDIIRNPKLQLDKLEVVFDIDYRNMGDAKIGLEIIEELETVLKSAHQLNVKNLYFESSLGQPFHKILPYLKPGYLKTIEIELDEPSDAMEEEIVEMEQWKQAQELITSDVDFVDPLRPFYHCKEFRVDIKEISVAHIRQIKEVLFKSPNFERCSFSFKIPTDTSAIRQEFGDAIRGTTNTYHYPIPNTTDYFEIKFEERGIGIARKKK